MLPTIWIPLVAHLQCRFPDVSMVLFDRYVSEIHDVCLNTKHWIWIGHSLGFMQLWADPKLKEALHRMPVAAVSVQGFTHLPEMSSNGSLSKGNARKLGRDLGLIPEQALTYFYRSVGLDKQQIKQHLARFNQGKMLAVLRAELSFMQEADISEALRQRLRGSRIALLALSANRDRIVRRQLTEASFATHLSSVSGQDMREMQYPARVIVKQVNSSSHCLPLSQPAWCAEVIGDFIDGLSVF